MIKRGFVSVSGKTHHLLLPALTVAFGLLLTGQVTAQTFTNLYSFTGGNDGGAPYAGLILSSNTLYGTTPAGGSSSNGTVFAVNTDGSGFTNLYSFTGGSDGGVPYAGLILSGNTLYGTTTTGGSSSNGTVFAVNTDGSGFTNLHGFTGGNDGGAPYAGLILSSNTLYGTAAFGGSSGNGTVFAVNTDGSGFTNPYRFTGGNDGGTPAAGLILSSNTLYGTTTAGGSSGNGTVFAVNTDGSGFTNLYGFTGGSDGGAPSAGLILSSNTLYGTTTAGGGSGKGTVFAVNTDGSGFTNLHSFTGGNDGGTPAAGLILSGNTLYGTATAGGSSGNGTLFAVNTDGSGFANLYRFTGGNDGGAPSAGLILSSNTLYGTTSVGGSSGKGTVFGQILTPPTITTQPANLTVSAGTPATFTVLAGGTPPLSYQWTFNNTNIVGATNAILNLVNVQPSNGGVYALLVSNAYGAIVSSNALLTVLIYPPSIATQPANQTVYAGDTARFAVLAGGSPPLNYQWSFNATNLAGATNAALIMTNAQPGQSGNYSVLVTNAYGSTNSVTVTLTVNPALPSAGLLPFPLSANQRGTVTCLENPSYTYDIYLPPAYSTHGGPLPIIYTMDPGGGGMVSTFQSTCSSLNIICVGITGSRNGRPWIQELPEMYAVALDVRARVLFDPTAEFAGGFSGGGECSYMFSRFRAQHVAGVFEMAGWLARVSPQYYGIDRVQTNLLDARISGTSDSGAIAFNPLDSNYLATCGVVINDWWFNGGHQVPPAPYFSPILSWLLSQRIPAGPSDDTNAFMLYTNWQARIAAGKQESVLRECVSNLMNFPRSWYAYQAQLTLDQLLADYTTFRTLNVSNLAQGDFASDLFFYYAYGAAANRDWPRYNSCMKALTGITVTNDFNGTTTITNVPFIYNNTTNYGAIYITTTNGDRAGDIYNLLTSYHHYPSPQVQGAADSGTGQFNLWLSKDTPGLAYSVQSTSNLLDGLWPDVPVVGVDTDTTWSTSVPPISGAVNGFYRIKATPSPATSPPWPPQ
jgi:uncharacterized repeat protein (TIGR03803 family)